MEFSISNDDERVSVSLDEVFDYPSCFGGYDVKGTIEIRCGCYSAIGEIWLTTEDICRFYEALRLCYNNLEGEASFRNYEESLTFSVRFEGRGHFTVHGHFQEVLSSLTKLEFEFESDQSYLMDTVEQLQAISAKYGASSAPMEAEGLSC